MRLWFSKRLDRKKPRAIILLYHRVAELRSDPQLLSVTTKNFAEQIDCLCRYFHPIGLRALTRHIGEAKIPNKGVVITFDDGYRDNLYNARPVLDKFDVPATVFVTTDKINSTTEFWWDDLERILLLPQTLPDTLEITFLDKIYKWNINKREVKDTKEWNVTVQQPLNYRQKAYIDLSGIFRSIGYSERENLLSRLRKWAGISETGRQEYLALTSEEVCSLANGNLVEIGSHGATHTVLSSQDDSYQKYELVNSKKKLDSILEQPIISFSYPFGGKRDYTESTIALIKNSGYQYACSNFQNWILSDTDLFQLPRYIIRNWGGYEFTERINQFFYQ